MILEVIALAVLQVPVNIKFGVNPDTTSVIDGYTTTLDGLALVDQGKPASVTCTPYPSGATFTCIPFTVSIPAIGAHTVVIAAYNLVGSTPASGITFTLPASSPSTPVGVHIIR